MTTEVYPFAPKGLPWLRYDIALPAVFMVFLIFPVSSIWNDSVLSAGAKALGYVIVLVFGASWLVAFAWLDIVPSRRSSVWVRWCAVFFLLLTAGLWQLIQWNAIGLLPFVISFLVYLSPPREAGLLSLVLLGATVGLAVVQGWPSGSIELVIVSTMVLIFASVSVGLTRASISVSEMERNLALISERERMGRDVHDGLGHTLTVTAIKAELAERLIDSDPDRARAELQELRGLLRTALTDVRATVGGLRANTVPTQIEALRISFAGAEIDFEVRGDFSGIPQNVDAPIAWILREACTNVLRHADATRCAVSCDASAVGGVLTIVDDGVGFAFDASGERSGSFGLAAMRERADMAGLRVEIGPADSGGSVDGGERPAGRVGTRVEVAW
ncbi:sensor histidine kinase [Populibacterium corticicola]|uniref:Sensor histidine kinase n=1 Tax=Populibacterium corticicola TaxID=1812826 RepID=A0ABW5XG10_9MICO